MKHGVDEKQLREDGRKLVVWGAPGYIFVAWAQLTGFMSYCMDSPCFLGRSVASWVALGMFTLIFWLGAWVAITLFQELFLAVADRYLVCKSGDSTNTSQDGGDSA